MTTDNRPLVFRKEQIENFVERMREASIFDGPNGEPYKDDLITNVLEEVESGDVTLTDARVSIEVYINNELLKDPSNYMFMRLSDAVMPIINEVIEIEIKMYGVPKYIVSKDKNSAMCYKTIGGDLGIESIKLPTDIMDEVKKYSFISVTEPHFPTLPDEELTEREKILKIRFSYFDSLKEEKEDLDVVSDDEEKWMLNFKKEATFNFLDSVMSASVFHEQISYELYKGVLSYCNEGKYGDDIVRDENAFLYEKNCDLNTYEVTPGDFITTACEASRRALFTVFALTSHESGMHEDFKDVIKTELDTENEEEIKARMDTCIASFLKLYAKYPIFEDDVKSICVVFIALSVEHQKHFYIALNDLASYYNERNFFASEQRCYHLKEVLSEMNGSDEGFNDNLQEAEEESVVKDEEPTPGVFFID